MSDTQSTDDDPQEPLDNVHFIIEDAPVVAGGHVTIPAEYRNRIGIVADDIVDLTIYTDDDVALQTDTRVNGEGQISIRSIKRRLYDIEEGDSVDVEVATTNRHLFDTDDETETDTE